jgi:putative endonuclease
MNWWARVVYGALVWRERRDALRAKRRATGPGSREAGRPVRPDAHLETGRRGERLVYWHLRQAGYTMVARNRRPGAREGELDIVAWDGPVLAFVEVKTRSSSEAGPPEAAVRPEQRRRILQSAQAYLHRLGRRDVSYRFDIASVFWTADAGFEVRVFKNAFRDRPRGAHR